MTPALPPPLVPSNSKRAIPHRRSGLSTVSIDIPGCLNVKQGSDNKHKSKQ
ncbi:unnamed protein product [Schistosoma mattheei]|uniref:Uncharacterized protein n=1 Tax=Schistosoma mattheei TaxID=31246 RepID=A0A3P8J770_9TREM|nr:unnamed protein product [Schistosoma mattheei]